MTEAILKIKGEEITKGKIPVDIYKDKEGAFSGMADMMVEAIKENNKLGKRTLFICPLGPIGQYKYFAKRVNSERISLKNVTFINMDEYMLDEKQFVEQIINCPLKRQCMNSAITKSTKI